MPDGEKQKARPLKGRAGICSRYHPDSPAQAGLSFRYRGTASSALTGRSARRLGSELRPPPAPRALSRWRAFSLEPALRGTLLRLCLLCSYEQYNMFSPFAQRPRVKLTGEKRGKPLGPVYSNVINLLHESGVAMQCLPFSPPPFPALAGKGGKIDMGLRGVVKKSAVFETPKVFCLGLRLLKPTGA